MVKPVTFLATEDIEPGVIEFMGKTYTAEEALRTPGLARRAVFTFELVVTHKLDVLSVQSNCPSQFISVGDKFEIDTSGEHVVLKLNGEKLSLVREFNLRLHAAEPSRLTIVILNLANRVHNVPEK